MPDFSLQNVFTNLYPWDDFWFKAISTFLGNLFVTSNIYCVFLFRFSDTVLNCKLVQEAWKNRDLHVEFLNVSLFNKIQLGVIASENDLTSPVCIYICKELLKQLIHEVLEDNNWARKKHVICKKLKTHKKNS